MKFFIPFLLIPVLAGCDRDRVTERGAESEPASSGDASAPAVAKTDTLKITYSKADPFEQKKGASKDTTPIVQTGDHAGHTGSPAAEKKSEHKEHEHK